MPINILESGKNKYAETKRHIRKAMNEKQLVLFVGAGASHDAGLPLWGEAVRTIAEKLNIKPTGIDNVLIPQYYYDAREEKEYTQLMRDIFHYQDSLQTQPIHKLILQFDVDTIITTNYDHLIEQAAEENGEFLQVVSQDSDLPYRKAGKELIKMHGGFEHDNFVLKEDDYLHYHKNFKLIENYVKSLIGTKTILFVGYSLSDPDVKQIFSWVKDILNNHFQMAYMIATGKAVNENEKEYYRHLGVNIVYSSELFDESIIKPNDHSRQLCETLNYLLDDEKSETKIADYLYDYLKPLKSLNYTYRKYIDKGFYTFISKSNNKCTLRIDNGYLSDSGKMRTEEDARLLDLIHLASQNNTDDLKIQTIFDVLNHSAVKGLVINEKKIPFSKSTLDAEWIEALESFNYKKLNQLKDDNSKILSESKPELYMQQAYIASVLEDYLTAYYCLDNAVKYFYRKREYAWYYIALWNKYNVAQIIINPHGFRLGADEKVIESIKNETDHLDLEKTFKTIPDLGNDQNLFLKDLNNFKFASDLFYDVVANSAKVSEQASTPYFLFAGMPAYETLRHQVYDYYRYTELNYLIVDRFRENNEIFYLFTRSLLGSISTPDKIKANQSLFGESANVHAENLTVEDIFLILRYVESSELRKLFHELDISTINLGDEELEYLKEANENIAAIFSMQDKHNTDIFFRYLCFVAHTNMDDELAEGVLKTIEALLRGGTFNLNPSAIIELVKAIYEQGHHTSQKICLIIKSIITDIIDLIADNCDLLYRYKGLLRLLLRFNEAGKSLYDDEITVRKILSARYISILVCLYAGGNETIKNSIKEFINSSDKDVSEAVDGYYAELVLAGIIDKNIEMEANAVEELAHYVESNGAMTSDADITNEIELVNLYLSDKIINKDRVKSLVEKSNDEFCKWLLDGEGYNYETFELSWLEQCSIALIKNIAENEKMRKLIVKKYKEKRLTKYIDKKTTDIIMEHFIR